jgi:hypothetical protein
VLKWPEKVGRGAIRVSAILAILLLVVQGAMTDEDVRFRLAVGEQFEGRPTAAVSFTEPVAAVGTQTSAEGGPSVSPWAIIKIRADKYATLPQARILVNGTVVADFSRPFVELRVMPGDVVEAESAYGFPVTLRIVSISPNAKAPSAGQVFEVLGGRIMMGKVMVR